ncbi:hypothetical protein [Bradyrhizobium sp. URHD0069]|uniref:hypothetical protein n=1 Tax=Bradyrhizobium sp. URHD0069 TaxID=1380355 RepID=UPI0012DF2351|nr:hypothetical protein [Bradyrhizobium sp. URHD0069]
MSQKPKNNTLLNIAGRAIFFCASGALAAASTIPSPAFESWGRTSERVSELSAGPIAGLRVGLKYMATAKTTLNSSQPDNA